MLCIRACMRGRPQKLSKQARAQQASEPSGQACLNLAALQAMTALESCVIDGPASSPGPAL